MLLRVGLGSALAAWVWCRVSWQLGALVLALVLGQVFVPAVAGFISSALSGGAGRKR